MPRMFDSSNADYQLRFTENVDCESCGTTFEGEFHDESLTVEDIVDPPVGEHTCPACGHHFASQMTGWTFYSEAG